MIYLDTSVALAGLFGEPRRPPDLLWTEPLIASRLIEYEIMVRVNARGLGPGAVAAARILLDGVLLVGLEEPVLARALQPFPVAVRTLDAVHVATMDFLRAEGVELKLATYDLRFAAAATALGFALAAV